MPRRTLSSHPLRSKAFVESVDLVSLAQELRLVHAPGFLQALGVVGYRDVVVATG